MKTRWKAVVAGTLVLLLVAMFLVRPSEPAPVLYPSPNGYDDLLKAAEAITTWRGKSAGSPNLTQQDQRQLLFFNAKTLDLARVGLGKDVRADPASPEFSIYPFHLGSLVELFLLEADDARRETNSVRLLAAETALLDLIGKGANGVRLSDCWSMNKTRKRVLNSLADVTADGDPALCRVVARHLFANMQTEPKFEDYLANERRSESALPSSTRSSPAFGPLRIYSRLFGSESQRRRGFERELASICQLEGETLRDLATTAFRLEHNRAAKNWTELVPEYLPEIPRNATNNAPLPLAPASTAAVNRMGTLRSEPISADLWEGSRNWRRSAWIRVFHPTPNSRRHWSRRQRRMRVS